MKPKKLTPIQWKLYNFIKEKTKTDGYTTIKEICENFDCYVLNEKQCNYSNCPQIYQDIDTINLSTETEKWIIKNRNHIKLGTEEECRKEMIKYDKQLSRVAKNKYRLNKKMKLNKQMKLLSNDNVPINESKGRKEVETYVN